MTDPINTTDVRGLYKSDNTNRQYDSGPAGSRAALESRARRAYHAIVEVEKARQTILGLPLEPPLSQLYEPLHDCDSMIEDTTFLLTGRKDVMVTTESHGERLAAKWLPRNPGNTPEIRSCTEFVQESGTRILRQMKYARDCGDFTGAMGTYDELWQAAVNLVGNAAAVSDAVSEGFETHAAEYHHFKEGNSD